MTTPPRWPADWADRVSGADCPMCRSERTDNDQYGVRVHSTADVDAVLQRADVQRGYTLVIWRGRHVTEPFDLTDAEAASYWRSVLKVAAALSRHYRPLKMNYLTLGNTVPHLHTHLIPRFTEDPAPGGPFPLTADPGTLPDTALQPDADALRALLSA